MKSKKNFLLKLLVDPLPILDYFMRDDDYDLIQAIMSEEGVQEAISIHTIDPTYARHIADRMHVEHPCVYPELRSEDVEALMARPVSTKIQGFLQDRKFPLELIPKYGISSWKYEHHNLQSLANYFPFNLEALNRASVGLIQHGLPVILPLEETMTCLSRDRQGQVNNIVFRFTEGPVAKIMAKWLFSHGRQATFGLDRIDPTKPVYVVEGFFDYIAMVEMGFTNTIGLGSAFISEAHERFLDGLQLVFVLDSDEVGKKYTDRLREAGRSVLYLNDELKDPYEYWIQRGTLRFNE
jgi:hypothetical protein